MHVSHSWLLCGKALGNSLNREIDVTSDVNNLFKQRKTISVAKKLQKGEERGGIKVIKINSQFMRFGVAVLWHQ